MQTLSFQSQKIRTDFMTITVPSLDNEQKLRNLANYFHPSFGFNYFLIVGNHRKILKHYFKIFQLKIL
jgi:hypothetical protein